MHQNTAELLPYVPIFVSKSFYMWISKDTEATNRPRAILFVVGVSAFVGVFFGRFRTACHMAGQFGHHMWVRGGFSPRHIYHSFLVCALTFGEGWHNNHTQPASRQHGLPGMKST